MQARLWRHKRSVHFDSIVYKCMCIIYMEIREDTWEGAASESAWKYTTLNLPEFILTFPSLSHIQYTVWNISLKQQKETTHTLFKELITSDVSWQRFYLL